MPDQKITDLVDGGAPQATDEYVIARAGSNFKIDYAALTGGASSSLSATGAVSIATNGSTISIGAPTQTVQTQNVVDVTLSGNTAGALALVSSGTMTLAGGNNITLSQAGNAITISGANAGGAQTAISGLANSEATYTSGTVELVGSGAITIASDAGQQFVFSVDPQSVQPETQVFIGGVSASNALYTSGTVRISGSQAATVRSGTGQLVIIDVPAQSTQVETQTFIAGISASDTLYTSGNVRLTGVGGGVTVSSNTGQRVDISVAAQSVQPETQTFIAGMSASDTLYTSGNVRITGVGGGITVSSNTGQRIDLSVAAQSVQPETQTFIGGVSASNTLYTSGSVRISGSQAVTVRSGTGQLVIIDAPAQSVQPETQTFIAGVSASDTLYTSGNVRITGVGGGVTVSSNTGQRIDISVAAPVAQSAQTGISGIANSQTTYTSGTVSLSELGAITIRSTTGNQYQLSVNSQSVQTQGGFVSLGVSTGGNTAGNTQVSTGSRFVLVASGNLTASQATAAGASTVTLSVAAQSVQTQGILNVALSNIGNTSGDTGINSGTRMVLAGGNNITLSASTAANATTITISAPNLGAGAMSAGVSTGGNTAGATGITGTQLVLVGVSPMSLSQTTGANGGTVSINAPATSSLSATGGISISTNGSTISIGAQPNTLNDWQNFKMPQATLLTGIQAISKTPFYWNDNINGRITANSFVFRLSAITTATLQSFSAHLGVYTFVNSTSAALVGSLSETYVLSTASSASWSGIRNYVMTGIGTHTALSHLTQGEYMFGMMFSAGATQSMNYSIMGAGVNGGPLGRIIPGVNNASTGTSQGVMPLYGRGSTTVNAMPANVVASEVINQGQGASMQLHPWIYIRS